MAKRSVQAPSAVVMIRPREFWPNPDTRMDNAFQSAEPGRDRRTVADAARREVEAMAAALERQGVMVHLFDEDGMSGPDSVFPNNWFSTHAGGHVAIYPMFSPSRRRERRYDIVEMLKREYRVQDVIDYSGLEPDGVFLEGTGAMVLDHVERVAYAVRSNRSNEAALERFCAHFNFEPVMFEARDGAGRAIYHTNVLMCIGTAFALIGLDAIGDRARRAEIACRLADSGRDVVDLTLDQIRDFAGNAIELQGRRGPLLVLSGRAFRALKPEQVAILERSAEIVPIDVPTIELAGGSVRCMVAGIHLARRTPADA